ncbi:protein SRG1-like [Daucus carota subsp. sativus]|uniref:protein SRG1-like n=1 Tax=Daucus carota subsp. sativus TaxID=79200 RepID=UPI0007F03C25|nr:PREDICTED: protein SRG1-like [Daucus carota subsp. sativus]
MEEEAGAVSLGGSLPVPSVQELVKTEQLKAVPSRYIRPDQDPIESNPNASLQIPVVNLDLLVAGDLENASKLDLACREWGFFQLTNHGVSKELLDKVIRSTKEFFEMPLDEKKKFPQAAGDLEGYGQAFVVSEEQKLDWADLFYVVTLPVRYRKLHLFNKFPVQYRIALEAYSVELKSIAMKLVNAMAKSLKMDPQEMIDLFQDGTQSMRTNYYPPCPEPDKVIGLASHSDAVGLTILLQLSDTEGLQVRKDGNWVTVRPSPYAFVVNIGDILEIITNGSYRSIEHRAICNSAEERISIATFLSPLMEQEFGPAASLIANGARPNFLRTTTADYYKGVYARQLGGKSYLDTVRL